MPQRSQSRGNRLADVIRGGTVCDGKSDVIHYMPCLTCGLAARVFGAHRRHLLCQQVDEGVDAVTAVLLHCAVADWALAVGAGSSSSPVGQLAVVPVIVLACRLMLGRGRMANGHALLLGGAGAAAAAWTLGLAACSRHLGLLGLAGTGFALGRLLVLLLLLGGINGRSGLGKVP